MERFSRTNLTPEDYKELYAAIQRDSNNSFFWYDIKDASLGFLGKFKGLEQMIEQTRARSKFEFMESEERENEYNTKKAHFNLKASEDASFMQKLAGRCNVEVCINNPEIVVPEIELSQGTAVLSQINGMIYNLYQSKISFDTGYAYLREEDQDLAHRLGLWYTPSGLFEVDSGACSDAELHKDKPEQDEQGNPILYCDNRCCEKQIKNPQLVLEETTGGIYHSHLCYKKDLGVKFYLAADAKEPIEPKPQEITREKAVSLLEQGELQQSRHNRTKEDKSYRPLKPWPEAAILFSP